MTPADLVQIRQIFREELAAALCGDTPQNITLDAEHMARLILEGRGEEVKQQQHELLRRAA